MTLNEFIESKPLDLSLGKYFYRSYLYALKPKDKMYNETSFLYHTEDDMRVEMYIKGLMIEYKWSELPEPRAIRISKVFEDYCKQQGINSHRFIDISAL